jgi:phage terminase Nu1 subunit (DNA packaging protein)
MRQKDLAKALGLSESAVTRLRQRGMPVHDLEAARAWRAANVAAYVRSDAPTPDAARQAPVPVAVPGGAPRRDLGQERAALAREQRARVALLNAIQRGKYAPIEMLAQVLANASQAVAERFDHLPGELRRACPDLPVAAVDHVMAVIAAARNTWVTETATLVAGRVSEMEMPEAEELEDDTEAVPTPAALREQLLTARLERERADAQFASLRTAEAAGELVRTDAVRTAHARRLVILREALLQIPARLAPVLAAESEQTRCHDTLQREIQAVLAQVSQQAGQPGERV